MPKKKAPPKKQKYNNWMGQDEMMNKTKGTMKKPKKMPKKGK